MADSPAKQRQDLTGCVLATITAWVGKALNLLSGMVPCTRLVIPTRVIGITLIRNTLVAFECLVQHLAGLVLTLALCYVGRTACLNGAVVTKVPTVTSKQWQGKAVDVRLQMCHSRVCAWRPIKP